MSDQALLTVEEFAAAHFPDGKVELVRGEARVMPPAGAPHAGVVANLLGRLIPYVTDHALGWVFGDGLGYELVALPRTVRNPDASFVQASRLPEHGLPAGFLRMAPDLAVEVLSPSESASELEEKLDDYRVAGTPLLWVIDPERRTVMIVSANAPVQWLREENTLDGGDVLPGFRCPVGELFRGLARPGGTSAL